MRAAPGFQAYTIYRSFYESLEDGAQKRAYEEMLRQEEQWEAESAKRAEERRNAQQSSGNPAGASSANGSSGLVTLAHQRLQVLLLEELEGLVSRLRAAGVGGGAIPLPVPGVEDAEGVAARVALLFGPDLFDVLPPQLVGALEGYGGTLAPLSPTAAAVVARWLRDRGSAVATAGWGLAGPRGATAAAAEAVADAVPSILWPRGDWEVVDGLLGLLAGAAELGRDGDRPVSWSALVRCRPAQLEALRRLVEAQLPGLRLHPRTTLEMVVVPGRGGQVAKLKRMVREGALSQATFSDFMSSLEQAELSGAPPAASGGGGGGRRKKGDPRNKKKDSNSNDSSSGEIVSALGPDKDGQLCVLASFNCGPQVTVRLDPGKVSVWEPFLHQHPAEGLAPGQAAAAVERLGDALGGCSGAALEGTSWEHWAAAGANEDPAARVAAQQSAWALVTQRLASGDGRHRVVTAALRQRLLQVLPPPLADEQDLPAAPPQAAPAAAEAAGSAEAPQAARQQRARKALEAEVDGFVADLMPLLAEAYRTTPRAGAAAGHALPEAVAGGAACRLPLMAAVLSRFYSYKPQQAAVKLVLRNLGPNGAMEALGLVIAHSPFRHRLRGDLISTEPLALRHIPLALRDDASLAATLSDLLSLIGAGGHTSDAGDGSMMSDAAGSDDGMRAQSPARQQPQPPHDGADRGEARLEPAAAASLLHAAAAAGYTRVAEAAVGVLLLLTSAGPVGPGAVRGPDTASAVAAPAAQPPSRARVGAAAATPCRRYLAAALLAASRGGHAAVVALLLRAGADPDAPAACGCGCGSGSGGCNGTAAGAGCCYSSCPLMEAADRGHTQVVARLLDAGAAVNPSSMDPSVDPSLGGGGSSGAGSARGHTPSSQHQQHTLQQLAAAAAATSRGMLGAGRWYDPAAAAAASSPSPVAMPSRDITPPRTPLAPAARLDSARDTSSAIAATLPQLPPLPPLSAMPQTCTAPPSPLLAACRAGHAETVELLLRRGAKVEGAAAAAVLLAATAAVPATPAKLPTPLLARMGEPAAAVAALPFIGQACTQVHCSAGAAVICAPVPAAVAAAAAAAAAEHEAAGGIFAAAGAAVANGGGGGGPDSGVAAPRSLLLDSDGDDDEWDACSIDGAPKTPGQGASPGGLQPSNAGGETTFPEAAAGALRALLAARPLELSRHLGSALVAAAASNRGAAVQALLAAGADAGGKDGAAALREAAYQGHLGVLQQLLAAGGARLAGGGGARAALRLAMQWGRGAAAEALSRHLHQQTHPLLQPHQPPAAAAMPYTGRGGCYSHS
ncbi:hypothetical protein HXX76_011839 [Chlamydomonas incerta]|uniref:Uncharacterized protein n=1 Tax=Chlamydomonas incerta TaxID=51695 RepID=A0A835VWJ9_CHLIN|nr:hypothetical protein HXX76_011839 [Chlamydomonas incerta]|eukprot:KAG2428159.1 hypothetical protein HXX76_011839 [Chlamydomonas incerta]